MNTRLLLLLVMLLPVVTTGAFARGQAEPNFPEELNAELLATGFDESKAEAVKTAGEELEWSEAEGADAALVARALRNAEDESTEGLEALDHALLALELARTTQQLENEGLSDREVSVATLESVSQLVTQIQAWKADGREDRLGEIVRETVTAKAEPARAEARERAQQPAGPRDDRPEGAGARDARDDGSRTDRGSNRRP